MTKKLSIIIPARNEPYLRQTIDDIFLKSAGDIEVLVMLDGWKPEEPLIENDNLNLFHIPEAKGMNRAINFLAAKATGDYLMKVDAHCCFAEGFDVALMEDIEEDWLVTPSRYRLDVNKWDRKGEAVEYLYVTFPYNADTLYGSGFHGKKYIGMDGIGTDMGKKQYYWMETNRKHVKIDDIQTIQGSLWCMSRKHFYNIDGKDERHLFFFQEPQELTFKTWMIGGRCKVNKNTWYAHWHKDSAPQYGMRKSQKHESERFNTWVWMNDKWPKTRPDRTISWFVNSEFYPMPGWPAAWQTYIRDDGNFTIFDEEGNDGFRIGDA